MRGGGWRGLRRGVGRLRRLRRVRWLWLWWLWRLWRLWRLWPVRWRLRLLVGLGIREDGRTPDVQRVWLSASSRGRGEQQQHSFSHSKKPLPRWKGFASGIAVTECKGATRMPPRDCRRCYAPSPCRWERKGCCQRTSGACDGRGAGLVAGAAADRGGGSEILSKRACSPGFRSAMSCLTCPRPLASSARLCRTAARPSDIASSFGSRFEDGAPGAGSACGMGMIVSLEDCQTEPRAMPNQKLIGNALASNACLSSKRPVTRNRSFFESVETFASAGTSVASTGGAQRGTHWHLPSFG